MTMSFILGNVLIWLSSLFRFLVAHLLIIAAFVVVGCDTAPSSRLNVKPDEPPDVLPVKDSDLLKTAATQLRHGNAKAAWNTIQECLVISPTDSATLEVAGDIAAALNDLSQVTELYQMAIEHAAVPAKSLLDKTGQAWMQQGRPFEAISVLRVAVNHYPNDPKIRVDLAGLLAAVGLEHDAGPHLRWLVMRGHAGLNELLMVSDLTRPQSDEKIVQYALKHAPDDLRIQFTKVREDAYRGRWQIVVESLTPVVQQYPDFTTAVAFYGRGLVETDDEETAAAWARDLPAAIQSEPQFWLATAAMANRRRQHVQAITAYERAYQLDPNDGEVLGKLATALSQAGYDDEAQATTQLAGLTGQLRTRVDQLRTNYSQSQRDFVEVAQTLQQLGRLWEAAAWLRVGATLPATADSELKDLYLAIHGSISAKTPWQTKHELIPESIKNMDLANFDWQTTSSANDPEPISSSLINDDEQIQFVDQAGDRGLNHVCRIEVPADGSESGMWLYQSGAGGAATMDFDLDGWPDVYLTKMDGTPKLRDSSANALYRNLSGQFREVTELASVGDNGFAQGLAVGDYNSDGFDDLYVANIGSNRLYQNCGDGTFRDVTETVGLNANEWTSSVAMVDIDQDGNLDLFDVGYCGGDGALTQPCHNGERRMACLPKSFPAQQDRVWAGRADGKFEEKTENWLGPHSIAHGLGIVAGFFDDQPGMDLYVANDMSGNHFWSTRHSADTPFQLHDEAMLRGLAVDNRSLAQASMGIAVGDPDADGDTDFYLTHFNGEYNTYYEQIRPGMWADLTSQVRLAEPTIAMLAFGTAWLDADNDGSLELMVANGHLNDHRDQGTAFRMPMQLFRRRQDGTWSPLEATSLGAYFTTARLGRSLITLDADRDGRVDALVTHLFDPVSLLMNESETLAGSLRFFLVARNGHRNATGATVSISVDGQRHSQQLTTGSGYQAASQRYLAFGIAPTEKMTELSVRWPSGNMQTFALDTSEALNGGGEYLLVEGDDQPFRYLAP
jgi:Flp pilus assembly protein TadD